MGKFRVSAGLEEDMRGASGRDGDADIGNVWQRRSGVATGATLSAIKLGLAHIHGDLYEHVCREQSLLTCANIYGICPILRAGGGRNILFILSYFFFIHPRVRVASISYKLCTRCSHS